MAKKPQKPKNVTRNGLELPDLSRFKKISENFLYVEKKKAQIFARWELEFLWTRFREMTPEELENAKESGILTTSETLIVNQLQYMLKTHDLTELNRVYDRLLGKPKSIEMREEKEINDIEFSIDLLNPNDNNETNNPIIT